MDRVREAVKILCEREDHYSEQMIDWRTSIVRHAIAEIDQKSAAAREGDLIRSAKTKAELSKLRASLKKASYSIPRLPKRIQSWFGGLDLLVRRAERLTRLPPGPKHRTSHKQRQAVEWAEFLITVTDEMPSNVTRGGQWARLAAVLYGDRKADLYRHLVAHKRPRSLKS